MKFLVYHVYDVDGGLGDAIYQDKLLGILDADSLEKAEKWAKDNSHDHIYDIPYSALHEGNLKVVAMELPTFTLTDCPWSDEDLKYLNDPRTWREKQEDECKECYEEEGYDAMPYWYDEGYEDE